jgi:hypothetical protein
MTIEEAIGHLGAVEERKKKTSNQGNDGHLLLIEEEWPSHLKVCDGEGSSGSGGYDRGRRGGRGSHGECQDEGTHWPKANDVCRTYGKLIHWTKECRSKAKKMGQANLVEQEEGGLMLVQTDDFKADARLTKFKNLPSLADKVSPPPISSAPCDSVHPIEEKVFAQLGEEEEGRSTSKWVVNTDATNHMTGARAAFVELDINVWGKI